MKFVASVVILCIAHNAIVFLVSSSNSIIVITIFYLFISVFYIVLHIRQFHYKLEITENWISTTNDLILTNNLLAPHVIFHWKEVKSIKLSFTKEMIIHSKGGYFIRIRKIMVDYEKVLEEIIVEALAQNPHIVIDTKSLHRLERLRIYVDR